MVEVLEPNWHKFETEFRKVKTVDEVLKIHTDFVDSCLNECMLTDPRLVRVGFHSTSFLFSVVIIFLPLVDFDETYVYMHRFCRFHHKTFEFYVSGNRG